MSSRLTLGIIILIVIIGFFLYGISLYSDWLWFDNLGFSSVYLTMLFSRWGLQLAAWAVFFVFLFINLYVLRDGLLSMSTAKFQEAPGGFDDVLGNKLSKRKLTIIFLLGSLFISFLFSSYAGGFWLEMRQFFHGVDFGVNDPILGQDASFYVFQLPFWRFLYGFLQAVVIVTLIIVGIIYFLINPPVQVGRRMVFLPYRGQGHLSLLLALAFFLKAWDYRLQMYELLFSPRGVTFGAGYTDLHANLPALWILLFMALGIGGLLIYNIFRRSSRLIFVSIGVLLGTSLVVGSIYPAVIQNFRVSPNEFTYERPYLEHNIEFTNKAFALDEVTSKDYPATPDLDWDDLDKAGGTLDNVRLWDYRPLLQTYNQLQGIRPYYVFTDVDTDRYYLGDDYRQVMLSLRELDQDRLPERAQTWVNLRLQYTHGYGLTMSPVASVTPQGLPEFVVRDIPPQSHGAPEVEDPEIYYGELTDEYVIANTNTPEFNHPRGGQNEYTHYDGSGGVPLSNLGRRLLYALKFSDYRVLISGEIHEESRIMFNRRIQERVYQAAPFLEYDADPYPVVHNGRIFWIQDAYTVTDNYPYAEKYGGINYMRNSVKVVIDAYNGSMDFFVADPDDPIIETYASIFPDLFRPLEEMPEGLFEHLRYPEEYFGLQARVYSTYHMTDPIVFYNREDLWEIPNEKYAGRTQPMEPYYTVLQLPGEEESEFVMMLPFTPARRDNAIAWMAGRADGENYGELMVYHFPKERVIYGPMQIETRIDQNPEISQQLTLWDQRGSSVIRGNLLVLPVNESVLYVEPVFLEADDSELPELGRVIVGFEDTVVMEPTLGEALISLFGYPEDIIPEEIDPEAVDPEERMPLPGTVQELAAKAQELFQEAQEKQKEGDWSGYGEVLEELEEALRDLARLSDIGEDVDEAPDIDVEPEDLDPEIEDEELDPEVNGEIIEGEESWDEVE